MRFDVVLTDDAEQDLEQIYGHIARADAPENADHVLGKLLENIESLATLPDRGSVPKELSFLGIQEYRQVFFKAYRIIYRVIRRQVVVYVIADGRRDMQSLLSRRLLRG